MPDYSVTIKLSGVNPSHVVQELQRVFGLAVAREAIITFWGHSDLYLDPCRDLDHFVCVHWTSDDVESRCHELGIEPTPELVTQVRAGAAHVDDGMTELGWEVIESAILESVT